MLVTYQECYILIVCATQYNSWYTLLFINPVVKMTSLLPKSAFEFSKAEYWDAFFKQRGNKSFEW